MQNIVELPDRAVIEITGEEARDFLQGLITNDIAGTEDGDAIHAGLLTPQGKLLFDFFVVADGKSYFLDCVQAQLEELVKRLTFYKLRAKVEIRALPDFVVLAGWNTDQDQDPAGFDYGLAFEDPRLKAMGSRVLLAREDYQNLMSAETIKPGDAAAYHAWRISYGVPEGGRDFAFGDSFPHEACMDQLNGIDFKKGCYVGQEVVSRMQHRGTARKRVVPLIGDKPLPAPGAEITAGGPAIGRLGSVSGNNGLALIRLDRAEKALNEKRHIMAGDVRVQLALPEWADFEVPLVT